MSDQSGMGDWRRTLEEAFEDAAEKHVKGLRQQEVAPDQIEDRVTIATIEVKLHDHNQWVKAYRVGLQS